MIRPYVIFSRGLEVINEMKQVQVLLSSYNGEHYIYAQLQSILKQSYPHISVLVRDDGSSDQTLALLKEYAKVHPDRIKVIAGSNVGVVSSFLSWFSNPIPMRIITVSAIRMMYGWSIKLSVL